MSGVDPPQFGMVESHPLPPPNHTHSHPPTHTFAPPTHPEMQSGPMTLLNSTLKNKLYPDSEVASACRVL